MGKSKTKNEPWAPAQPYILKGMEQVNNTFDVNQPRLQDMSKEAYDAFKGISPGAFQSSGFVENAQRVASGIANGDYFTSPGQATYARLQGGPFAETGRGGLFGSGKGVQAVHPSRQRGDVSGMYAAKLPQPRSIASVDAMNGNGDPSMSLLSRMAATGQNPADGFASAVAGGQYLNAQPSASMYGQMMDPSYSQANPYLDAMLASTRDAVTKQANQRFAARGMGSGVSSAFSDILTKNLAGAENELRYQNYGDAENRRLQAAGQSDAAFGAERGRMEAAAQLLANNYNAGEDRRLTAAQALGSQYGAGQDRALAAAQAADAQQSNKIQQMLTALGLTGDLRGAEFAGVAPALALLNTAADLPYIGTAALNGQIRQASDGYGVTTQSGGLGQALINAGATLGSAAIDKIKTSDRRLKRKIEQVGQLEDGLGVYEFEYLWGGPRQRGVMADEVAKLRPWALGPRTREGYATVDYGAL